MLPIFQLKCHHHRLDQDTIFLLQIPSLHHHGHDDGDDARGHGYVSDYGHAHGHVRDHGHENVHDCGYGNGCVHDRDGDGDDRYHHLR